MTMAGSSVCAHVDATGPKPASPTTSSVPKLFSARRKLATASGCGSTIRIFSGSGTLLSRRHDPPGSNPALALIRQLHFEPVSTLADDLQLGPVLHLVEHAGGDRGAAANVRGIDGYHRQVLRQ